MRYVLSFMFWLTLLTGTAAQAACQATPQILPETRLTGLADFWFGTPEFRYTIMLATNARAVDPLFAFISNPNALPQGKPEAPNHVCIPDVAEAEQLKERFDRYLEAVNDMAVAEPSEIINSLDAVPQTGPVTVVSWIRSDQVDEYRIALGKPFKNKHDMWVTLAPHVQDFCTAFTTGQSTNPDRLTLRLEQRLGLPPAASKTHFLEIEVAHPADGKSLFRPCGDPSATTTTCQLGGPAKCAEGDAICHARADFFYAQYYNSYGTERPVEYPWTSLGYTFDWAPAPVGPDGKIGFVRVGESEYVIPADTELFLKSITPTADYCGPT